MKKLFVLPEQNDPIWDALKTAIANSDFKRSTIEFEIPKDLKTGCVEVEYIDLDYGENEDGKLLVWANISLSLEENSFLMSEALLFGERRCFELEPSWDELYSVIGELFAKVFLNIATEVNELYQGIKAFQEAMRIQHEQL